MFFLVFLVFLVFCVFFDVAFDGRALLAGPGGPCLLYTIYSI